ncbi:MAG: hypothetical protein AB8G22_03230 [Saprospiraceae bacterium]
MSKKLDKLAAKEQKILAKLELIDGTIAEQIAAIKAEKIYQKYQKIHQKYLKIAQSSDDPTEAEEALKRGIFINWFAFVEPDFISGIGELEDEVAVAFYSILEDEIREQTIDNELVWMLFYYAAKSDWVLLYYAERRFPNITKFVARTDQLLTPVLLEKLSGQEFTERGQMGIYWDEILQ